jgi:UDP-N-acetylglucosamine acyltransferase
VNETWLFRTLHEKGLLMQIHPTAVIEEGAVIGDGTRVGPFCVIGGEVTIGKNNNIHSNVTIDGCTTIGDDNEIFSYACLGKQTQDMKFRGGKPRVRIGDRNSIREYATVHAATNDGDETIVGNDCLIQAYCHVAHDCLLGNQVILSSGAKLSGHVVMGNGSIVSGMTGVIQFVKIGEHAFVGGFSKLTHDVLPYCIADGIPAATVTINKVGLERLGVDKADIREIHRVYKAIFKTDKTLSQIKDELRESDNKYLQVIYKFLESSDKGLARG